MATRRKVLREGTRKKIEYFDYNLLAVLIFIICFGLIMLYSASAYNCLLYTSMLLSAIAYLKGMHDAGAITTEEVVEIKRKMIERCV